MDIIKEISGMILYILVFIAALTFTIILCYGIFEDHAKVYRNELVDCQACGHKNHAESQRCMNCGKSLGTLDWYIYVLTILMLWTTYYIFVDFSSEYLLATYISAVESLSSEL